MKKTNLNNEQSNLLTNAIANIVYNLKKYDAVNSISMFYYKKIKNNYISNTDMLRINVMVDSYDEELFEFIDELNGIYNLTSNKVNLGLKINHFINFINLDNISFKQEKELFNSIILYDKNGKLFELQDQIKNKADFRYIYNNTIENNLKLRNIRK